MKNHLKAAMIITWMVIIAAITQVQAAATINFQTFYHELRPYGAWMSYGNYGNVWMPNAGREFRPYATNGYWAVTDYGNTWVSDYAWGWAPFHYGRWLFDDFYGWLWVPGSEWAPAWVAWRSGNGYYGWAPLGPRADINVTINIPNQHWYFVPQQNLCGPEVTRYFVSNAHGATIYHRTTIVNHIYEEHNHHRYFTGPSRREIEARRGRSVEVYTVNRSERPGTTVIHNRTITMYRPSFESRSVDTRNNNRTSPVDRRNNDDRYNTYSNEHKSNNYRTERRDENDRIRSQQQYNRTSTMTERNNDHNGKRTMGVVKNTPVENKPNKPAYRAPERRQANSQNRR